MDSRVTGVRAFICVCAYAPLGRLGPVLAGITITEGDCVCVCVCACVCVRAYVLASVRACTYVCECV